MIVLAALALASATPGWFPKHRGECGWVHGSFRLSNGSGIQRLWVIGTRHKLNLYDSDVAYPPALQRLVDSPQYRPFDTTISGDFRVCALERWIPEHMQHIRFEDARRLVLVE